MDSDGAFSTPPFLGCASNNFSSQDDTYGDTAVDTYDSTIMTPMEVPLCYALFNRAAACSQVSPGRA